MIGRDPNESHRPATPLELLLDLTFVVAFAQAGSQMAHLLAEGHVGAALFGFAVATFAICWAWINYTWLASAYDNDDAVFRTATLVVMVGVLIVALGIPDVFHSVDEGVHLDNRVMVFGYIVMRAATLGLWVRAARHDPARRRTCMSYVTTTAIAQVGWVVMFIIDPPLSVVWIPLLLLVLFEMLGPVLAERQDAGTPWHPHHVAERYGLLVIITLGEIILGTITAISAVVDAQGWTVEAALVAVAGTALAFALWWVYFTMPSGEMLARHRERGFAWGYLHIILYGSLAAVGAGMHVGAYVIEHEAHVSATFAVLTTAVPVVVFLLTLFVVYSLLMHAVDRLHTVLFVGALVALAGAVWAVSMGLSFGTALLLVALSPVIVIIGYETVGHRHQAELIARDT
ncbi:low temperature requirement protein A [Ruania halotolerans]|uniref:low temperature requirement protein A n=1 Tax=Ruania halotolerans TaxID=2897773 RepID=UPI001E5DBF78|nr:low temperature requirement protein A [Ruania halotolerans]UFU07322.1 low temperature requirement protein A [Ruania halotolerans]